MKRTGLVVVLAVVLSAVIAGMAPAQQPAGRTYPLMKVTRASLDRWSRAHRQAPRARIDARVSPARGPYSLLSHLRYVPDERDQSSCGNCWCWAGTGCMEISLDVQNKILDRLSVQFVNSNEKDVINNPCCDGGWLENFAAFYSAKGFGMAVPWSNAGAKWQDGDASCDTLPSAITTAPNYPIKKIEAVSIDTFSGDNAAAIANIKNVLNQGKGVWFGWFLPSAADWDQFFNAWNNQNEATTIKLDIACGHTWTNGSGGHAVLCVGYDDSDPTNRYWVMLNSWGTADGNRPNGLFRLNMDMDYGCWLTDGQQKDYSFYWECLNMTFDLGSTGSAGTAMIPSGKPQPGPRAKDEPVVIDTSAKQEFTIVTPANQSVDMFLGMASTFDQADLRLAYTGDAGMNRLPAKTFATSFEGRWMVIGNMAAPNTFGKIFRLKQAIPTADGVQWVFTHGLKAGDSAGIYQNIDGKWVNTYAIVCH